MKDLKEIFKEEKIDEEGNIYYLSVRKAKSNVYTDKKSERVVENWEIIKYYPKKKGENK